MHRSLARRRHSRLLRVGSATLVLLAPLSALALTADDCVDICGIGTGACTISAAWDVERNSVLDCSGRDLSFTIGGSLTVTDGDLTLRCRNLTIDGSAAGSGYIMANEGPDESTGAITIELADPADLIPPTTHGNLLLRGAIRANGQHDGGRISIVASGNVTLENYGTDGIEAGGTGAGASGGEIVIEAGGSVSLYDPIHAEGAGSGDTAGGSIEIRALGNILTDDDGHLSVQGRTLDAGYITLVSSGGDVTIREHVEAQGIGEEGDGGTITIEAANHVEIAQEMYVRGGYRTGGGAASGGDVTIEAGCGGVTISSSIFAHGGTLSSDYKGGSISVESAGNTTIGANVVLNARGVSTGSSGGVIRLRTRNLLQLASTSQLDARGHSSAPARGGDIILEGCRVNVPSGAVIDATGAAGGTVLLGASEEPGTGTQPLFIGSSAQVKASGGSSTAHGAIRVAPKLVRPGECSNNGDCFLNSDCTVGCETGTCTAANPDVQGVITQFDIAPVRTRDLSLPACWADCE